MLGYDRPLKPEWIYSTLKQIEVGSKPEEFYDTYNQIAVELTGKDGRRKTRTILFRTFIYSFQEKLSKIEDNVLIDLSRSHDLDYMKPLYMAKFMIDYEILAYFTKIAFQIFDASQIISTKAITAKMVEKYGDLEIVKRSTRAFLKTLHDFKLIEKISQDAFRQLPKEMLSNEQVRDVLILYSNCIHTKQINLSGLEKTLFAWYKTETLSEIAQQLHPSAWEYIIRNNEHIIMLK